MNAMSLLRTALVLAILAIASPALAVSGDMKEAKRHAELGKQFYAQAHYADALQEYQRALDIVPLPLLHYNVGRCHEQLGQYQAAIQQYEAYLRLSAKPPADRAETEEKIRVLRQKLLPQMRIQIGKKRQPSYLRGEVAGGAGVLLAATGAVLWSSAVSQYRAGYPDRDPASVHAIGTLANVGTGFVLAGGLAIYWLLHPSYPPASQSDSAFTLSPFFREKGGGLTLGLRR